MFFLPLDLGYFMSMDASKGQQSDRAGLYVKFKGDTCLTFWYNMRGNGAGSIEVTVNNKNNPVLELKGPKDAIWHKAQVEVTGAKRKVRLILRPHYARELRRKKKLKKQSFLDSCLRIKPWSNGA